MLGGLWGCTAHILVDILAGEGSRISLHVSRHDEEEEGKSEEAECVIVNILTAGFIHM